MPLSVNHVVDVTAQVETKAAAVLCHASQLAGWAARAQGESGELATVVQGRVLRLAEEAAAAQPFDYGEAFHRIAFSSRE
jgi:LmbE family N-acetylglucosaminyl deacetylase